MRKWLLSVLILALLGCSCVLGESEAGTQKLSCGDYDYVLLEDGTASITGYHGSAAELSIPEELDGRRVSSIGDYAFIGCTTLTSIVIPHGVSRIGECAFHSCESLTGVEIPDSVTQVGANPFACCTRLSSIRVAASSPALETVEGALVSRPDRRLICYPMGLLESQYEIPNGIKIIGDYAFNSCTSLTGVRIPESVTAIGCGAFFCCTSLTDV